MSEAPLGAHRSQPEAPMAVGSQATEDYRSLQPTSDGGTNVANESRSAAGPALRLRGRFTIVQPYAQGGLGQVSLAQDGDLNRTVALKEIRADRLDSPYARQRFLIEAEITGQLEHPGIVPVHALGNDDDGNPYYAMRFIEGRTLADAIAAYHRTPTPLGFRDLLQRFVSVCRTVAYAHSKQVIHRDLKPANIMLGDYGETLVLDWGLAKRLQTREDRLPADRAAAEGPLGDSRMTEAGQVLGTPAFMSPEQATGDLAQVGTAADVYSLGAILYQILTSRQPYEGTPLEALRRLREAPPPVPHQLSRRVPRALEAVCLKGMSRVASLRYGSAQELAEDVERYLADEPVGAFCEPWTVRTRRWIRRHRLAVTGIVALLVAAIPLSISLALISDKARRQAEADKEAVKTALTRATNAREFFQNEVFAQVRPKGLGLGKDVTMKRVLDAAVPKIGPTFADYPEDEAAICSTLSRSYYDLGAYDQAEELANRSWELYSRTLGADHPSTLMGVRQRAEAMMGKGKAEEVERLLGPALTDFRRVLGEDHYNTRKTANLLAAALSSQKKYEQAEQVLRSIWKIEQRIEGPDHEVTIGTQIDLGGVLFQQGKFAEAEPLLREGWQGLRRIQGEDDPGTLAALTNLTAVLQLQNKLVEAEPLLRQVVAQRRKILGDDHAQTLLSWHNLASLLREKGDEDEAEAVYREVLTRRRKALTSEHPATRNTMFHLADLIRTRRQLDEAEMLARELIDIDRKKPFPGTSGPAGYMVLLASVQFERGQAVESEKTLREALAILDKDHPKGNNMTFHATSLLGASLGAQKRFDEAEPLLLKSYQSFKAAKSVPRSQVREAATRLVRLYEIWGKEEEAARWRGELHAMGN